MMVFQLQKQNTAKQSAKEDEYKKEFYSFVGKWGSEYHYKFYGCSGGEKRRDEFVRFYVMLREMGKTKDEALHWARQFLYQEFADGPTLFKKYNLSAKEMYALTQVLSKIWEIASNPNANKKIRPYCQYYHEKVKSAGDAAMDWLLDSLRSSVGQTKWTKNADLIEDPEKRDVVKKFQNLRQLSRDVLARELDRMGSTKNADALLEKIKSADRFY
ncbi:MAG: hypothetical protein QW275_02880 [Candidatus Anstonellaceae archaeon]